MFDKLSEMSMAIDGAEILEVHPDEVYSVKQVRTEFSESEIEQLADSIQEQGQLQPCIVYPKDNNGYRLHVGERRWRATKSRGLTLKIVVEPRLSRLSQQDQMTGQLTENLQRENLNPKEIAASIATLMNDFGMKGGEIAKKLGKPGSWVTRYAALNVMPSRIEQEVYVNQGIRDAETLYQLIKLWGKNQAAAERLIDSGQLSRKAISQAAKGDVVPFTSQAGSGSASAPQEPQKPQEEIQEKPQEETQEETRGPQGAISTSTQSKATKPPVKMDPVIIELMIGKEEYVRLSVDGMPGRFEAAYQFVVAGLDVSDQHVVASVPLAKGWAAQSVAAILDANDQIDPAIQSKLRDWIDSRLMGRLVQSKNKTESSPEGGDEVEVNPAEIKIVGAYQGRGAILVLNKIPSDGESVLIELDSGERMKVAASDFQLLGIER